MWLLRPNKSRTFACTFKYFLRLATLALLLPMTAPTAWALDATPVIFNTPAGANPGDIIGLQGANFGDDPQVLMDTPDGALSAPLERINTWDGIWVAVRIPADATGVLRLRVRNGAASSAPKTINGAQPHHLDALQISPGGAARLIGRNLLMPGATPHLRVNGLQANIDLEHSSAYVLQFTAPNALHPGDKASILVDNGNGSDASTLDRDIDIRSGGKDLYGVGVGWAGAFAALPETVRNVTCSGVQDDTPGIQAAVDRVAASGGGVVQLPAGACQLAGSIQLRSRVVLQGAGKDQTTLRYSHSYALFGRALDLVAVRNLSMENTAGLIESPLLQNSTRVLLQNLRFALGGGIHMYLTGNRNMAVEDCDISQPTNPNGSGALILNDTSGLVFTKNHVVFAYGATALQHVHDAWLADNQFTRDIRGNEDNRVVVHQMAMDFAYRIAIVNNRFDVLGGPVTNKQRNDGETLLTEGGGGNRTEWTGTVQSATSTGISDAGFAPHPDLLAMPTLPENLGIAIVGGTGAGQTRRITNLRAGNITVDRAWDVVPDDTSRYATFLWGLEKGLILHNTLNQNPRGIWLYQTAVRDVDIADNEINEGGGIYLRTAQNLHDKLFTPMYGVRILGNQITNTNGQWPAYISVIFVRIQGANDFGIGASGIIVSNNFIRTNFPNLRMPQEEAGAQEGFAIRMHTEGMAQGTYLNQTRLLGTVYQNNRCAGCETGILVREGARGTVLDGNRVPEENTVRDKNQ